MKYAVYSQDDQWLYDVHGDSPEEALELAKSDDPNAFKVQLVSNQDDPRSA